VAHPWTLTDDLTRQLDDLVDRVTEAELAMVLSPDGLLLGTSRGVDQEVAEQVVCVAAGLQGLALAAGRLTGNGGVQQIIVQMCEAYLFLATTRGGALLAVRFAAEAEVAEIAYEVALFANQSHHDLPVELESAVRSPARG
jgi:predicted regulator of Ras-like GTPase activity (Roadblock/LC7/MglB family)